MRLKTDKPLLYLAAPLFSDAELSFNLKLVKILEQYLDVYLPQRDGGKVVDLVSSGVSIQDSYNSIFERDLEALKDSDVVLLVLDGRNVDEGAAFELGIAFAMDKHCIGLQTDTRRFSPLGNNPMIECSLTKIFKNTDELHTWANNFSAQLVGQTLQSNFIDLLG